MSKNFIVVAQVMELAFIRPRVDGPLYHWSLSRDVDKDCGGLEEVAPGDEERVLAGAATHGWDMVPKYYEGFDDWRAQVNAEVAKMLDEHDRRKGSNKPTDVGE